MLRESAMSMPPITLFLVTGRNPPMKGLEPGTSGSSILIRICIRSQPENGLPLRTGIRSSENACRVRHSSLRSARGHENHSEA